MNYRALFKYVFDINVFNSAFSIMIALILGIFWGITCFATLGLLIGYLGFNTFKKNEYYSYYNLGFGKIQLLLGTFIINMFLSLVMFAIYFMYRV